MSPPFVRVIRPRFLGFQQGGGGHVTIGGALCMQVRYYLSTDQVSRLTFISFSLTTAGVLFPQLNLSSSKSALPSPVWNLGPLVLPTAAPLTMALERLSRHISVPALLTVGQSQQGSRRWHMVALHPIIRKGKHAFGRQGRLWKFQWNLTGSAWSFCPHTGSDYWLKCCLHFAATR